ncbi:MAG: DUF4126 domain-containing protein [Flavobacteriales bacterium]|nr:MAG: DUF4126 domain-containing protein [Flavobacteriales bacterium]
MDALQQYVVPCALGVGLAAACGLRVFLPLFVTSLLQHFNVVDFGTRAGFEWIGDWPALISFGVASVVEVLSYYIPVVDHFLDTIAIPLAAIAGTLVSASLLADMPPLFTWSFAIIAGGGMAGAVSAGTATTRLASTATTAGLGNSIVATGETAGSLLISLLAWVVPLLVCAVVVLLLMWVVRRLLRSRTSSRTP